jgi:hypothetical protein
MLSIGMSFRTIEARGGRWRGVLCGLLGEVRDARTAHRYGSDTVYLSCNAGMLQSVANLTAANRDFPRREKSQKLSAVYQCGRAQHVEIDGFRDVIDEAPKCRRGHIESSMRFIP